MQVKKEEVDEEDYNLYAPRVNNNTDHRLKDCIFSGNTSRGLGGSSNDGCRSMVDLFALKSSSSNNSCNLKQMVLSLQRTLAIDRKQFVLLQKWSVRTPQSLSLASANEIFAQPHIARKSPSSPLPLHQQPVHFCRNRCLRWFRTLFYCSGHWTTIRGNHRTDLSSPSEYRVYRSFHPLVPL